MKHILITNDDGIHAKGIRVLSSVLLAAGYTVSMVAPDRNCSGQSHALTLRKPINISWINAREASVQGTPVDCVYLAVNGLLDQRPDMVISGINAGENLGDDVIYSGTVAAAREAYLAGIPAMAVSLAGHECFDTAAHVVLAGLKWCQVLGHGLLNINVPDCAITELKGLKMTRLGMRDNQQRPELVMQKVRGDMQCWVGLPAPPQSFAMAKDYDFGAIAHGFVSVTPLTTDHTCLDTLSKTNLSDFKFDTVSLSEKTV